LGSDPHQMRSFAGPAFVPIATDPSKRLGGPGPVSASGIDPKAEVAAAKGSSGQSAAAVSAFETAAALRILRERRVTSPDLL